MSMMTGHYIGQAERYTHARSLRLARMYFEDARENLDKDREQLAQLEDWRRSAAEVKLGAYTRRLAKVEAELQALERGEGGTHDPEAYTSAPVCPHCGRHDDEWWEYGDQIHDGNIIEAECGWCSEPFVMRVDVEVTFQTSTNEEDL